MSAFNWIVFQHRCPACGVDTAIRAQCHIASSYDGDISGRFCDKDYQLKQKMAWWSDDHPESKSWADGDNQIAPKSEIIECCYSICMKCNGSLYAVIVFDMLMATSVISLGLEENWPIGFKR
jgi:hypothetical protein